MWIYASFFVYLFFGNYEILDNYYCFNLFIDSGTCLALIDYYYFKTNQKLSAYLKILYIIVYCIICAKFTGTYTSTIIIAVNYFFGERKFKIYI